MMMLEDYGLIYNDDGDRPFIAYESPPAIEHITDQVDVLDGTPVKTLCYSAAAGSDIMYYDTEVASTMGWRKTELEESNPFFANLVRRAKFFQDQGIEVLKIIGERAKEKGLLFVPSARMNDGHYCQKVKNPSEHVLASKFHTEHLDCRLGEENYPGWLAWLPDYSHDVVRQYRLAVIFEIIDRFYDLMDGIELDFTRHGIFFPPNDGEKKGHLITEMVQKVRAYLDKLANDKGKRLSLIVRVHPSLAGCYWAGLEIEKWLQQQLIDVLVPAPWRAFAWDMPIGQFIELVQKVNKGDCKVYAGLESYIPAHIPYESKRPRQDLQASCTDVTPEMYRAAAANYYHMGVDGLYVFNFFTRHFPFTEGDRNLLGDLATPAALYRKDKCFAITRACTLGDNVKDPNISYDKQLPAALTESNVLKLKLMVGQDLRHTCDKFGLQKCRLKLGFRGLSKDAMLRIDLNGSTVLNGLCSIHLTQVSIPDEFHENHIKQLADEYLHIDIDPEILGVGDNDLAIELMQCKEKTQVELIDLELEINFDNR